MVKTSFGEEDVVLVGAGGHAKVVIEVLRRQNNYNIIGIADINVSQENREFMGVQILGDDSVLNGLFESGLRKAFISVGTIKQYVPRMNLYKMLKGIGFSLINIVHNNSILSPLVFMGEGNAVLAGAIINIDTVIGDNCIINTGSVIEHDCNIGSNIHVATGVRICGNVTIGDNCFIGAGTVIIQGIKIGDCSIIAAGSVVINDVPSNSLVAGAPAMVKRWLDS